MYKKDYDNKSQKEDGNIFFENDYINIKYFQESNLFRIYLLHSKKMLGNNTILIENILLSK